jgi:DnaJ-class molecular chaperone
VLVAMGLATEVDGGASLVAIDRERVSERLALAQASDYFTLLGLARAAGRAEVVRAHADLRATFAPERLEPASRNGAGGRWRELQAALDEARDVLLDEALRTAYLARLTEEEA